MSVCVRASVELRAGTKTHLSSQVCVNHQIGDKALPQPSEGRHKLLHLLHYAPVCCGLRAEPRTEVLQRCGQHRSCIACITRAKTHAVSAWVSCLAYSALCAVAS